MEGPASGGTLPSTMRQNPSQRGLPAPVPSMRRRLRDDDGQTVVEGAIVLPAMVFLVLTILQLTMVQHARIMTDYAAYCAARAGIVFNGDKAAMEQAATLALLPTIGRTDKLDTLTTTALKTFTLEKAKRAVFGLPIVRVRTLSPTAAPFSTLGRHLGGREIDFDDVRSSAAQANILQIQVEYFYRMPIPFANQILQNIFFAQRLNMLQYWGGVNMANPELAVGGMPTGVNAQMVTRFRYPSTGDPDAWALIAAAQVGPGAGGGYFFPLKATYSMRMQSNMYLKNVGN